MSRIGKKIIEIPKNVTVTIDGSIVKIKGPKGELQREIHPNMKLELKDSNLEVKRPDDQKTNKALHGLTRALVQNMVVGVTSGYKKILDIVGVGYRVELKGANLLLNMGYSHPIYFMPPAEIKIETPTQTQIVISGIDKQLVGQVAAKLRSIRKPEPYKGKGIKYSGEHILRKAGKTAGK
ncbi:MAG TPA: 50S ribosomal protein L6 [Ignavibacteriaceae bacterium]|nr:MAG: 50S ribosomal protein L6 [Ignavibacteria bacterium ADurb.Bin266]OQY69820.1 MAG: 50S ribosomal protein L6 [Ignavibacteriales bacterium UTCHB2]HQF43396.1 50S ribosomal protein L6 [Ignavibacteriaceae bacterium]HQI40412.1 50S ribosomal protein L6 [Ignavibacteriaceae bacterium]HQJ45909.1 50S ribosomal protein L6 [Ignavibacteriaceae bacterium]